MRDALIPSGSEVWVRVYGSDGREMLPEPRAVRVPKDFGESGRLPLNMKVQGFVRWVGVWSSPIAGAGVAIHDATSTDGFVCAAYMFDHIGEAASRFGAGSESVINDLRFAVD